MHLATPRMEDNTALDLKPSVSYAISKWVCSHMNHDMYMARSADQVDIQYVYESSNAKHYHYFMLHCMPASHKYNYTYCMCCCDLQIDYSNVYMQYFCGCLGSLCIHVYTMPFYCSAVLCVLCRPVLVVAATELSSVPSSMFFSPSEGTSLLGYSTTVSHGQL